MSNELPESIYKEPTEQKKGEIQISGGDVLAKTLQEKSRVVGKFLSDGAFPKSFQNVTQALAAWMLAEQLNLKPLAAIQQMAVINGVITIWGELPMALVQTNNLLDDINLFIIDENYLPITFQNKNLTSAPFAAVCHVKRKGQSTQEFVYTIEDAKLNPNFSRDVWKKNLSTMLKRRVRAQAIKFTFPDLLLGCAIAEYTFNTAPDLENELDAKASIMSKLENGSPARETT
jgi:hypothetical protein